MTAERGNAGDVVDQAIAWHLRLPVAGRDEWLAFVAWLEASPEHAAAYDRVSLDDAILTPALEEPVVSTPLAANDTSPMTGNLWRLVAAGGAMAAVLTLAVTLATRDGSVGQRYTIATGSGERRAVAFADGTRILLNSDSRLTLDHADQRFAALEAGEAKFEIRHDEAHPFVLRSGKLILRDLGTAFNVARDDRHLSVQVAEGAVMFEPDREGLTLRPGVALSVDEASRRIELSRVAVEDVGGWQVGRLTFGEAPLATVAAALGRATGARISTTPDVAALPFTGTITVDRDPATAVPRLARLTGIKWYRNGKEWTLSAARDEIR